MKNITFITLGFLVFSIVGCGNGFQSEKPGIDDITGVQSNFLIGAMGDSISRGYDIQSLGQEDLADNWVTGDSLPGSLLNLYKTAFGSFTNISALNVAVTGETVLGANSSFQTQASTMAASAPQVVTIEIGANDVCQGNLATGDAITSFHDKVVSALTTVTTGANPSAVVVVSIPHIFALTQISTLANNSNCQAAWALVCPNLQAGQAVFEAQWQAANDALESAATQVGGAVTFDNRAVANTAFTADDVSTLDCFHPSLSGQTKIANAIWQGMGH